MNFNLFRCSFFPDLDTNPNTRYCCLNFVPKEDGVIHGFAGYFEAVLYGKVTLSRFTRESIIDNIYNTNIRTYYPFLQVFTQSATAPICCHGFQWFSL